MTGISTSHVISVYWCSPFHLNVLGFWPQSVFFFHFWQHKFEQRTGATKDSSALLNEPCHLRLFIQAMVLGFMPQRDFFLISDNKKFEQTAATKNSPALLDPKHGNHFMMLVHWVEWQMRGKHWMSPISGVKCTVGEATCWVAKMKLAKLCLQCKTSQCWLHTTLLLLDCTSSWHHVPHCFENQATLIVENKAHCQSKQLCGCLFLFTTHCSCWMTRIIFFCQLFSNFLSKMWWSLKPPSFQVLLKRWTNIPSMFGIKFATHFFLNSLTHFATCSASWLLNAKCAVLLSVGIFLKPLVRPESCGSRTNWLGCFALLCRRGRQDLEKPWLVPLWPKDKSWNVLVRLTSS